MIKAGIGSSTNTDSTEAVKEASQYSLKQACIKKADWVLIFATFHHRNNYQTILEKVSEITGTEKITGCSSIGVLSNNGEIEGEPGIVVLSVSSDSLNADTFINPISTDMGVGIANNIKRKLGEIKNGNKIVVILPDPFNFHHNLFFSALGSLSNFTPIIGATCSEHPESNVTFQYNGKSVNSSCITGMLISGSFNQHIGLTQGCISAGSPLKITDCNQNVIAELDRKPAFEVLKEVVPSQIMENPNELMRVVSVGLRSVGNKISSSNRDYLVRNIVGIDEKSGAIGVAENIKVGDEIVITLRNPDMARQDLKNMLENLKSEIKDQSKIRFGIYFNCCGRGSYFYGNKDIDTAYISNYFPNIPIIGFFGNSEIAPVMGQNHLFTYTGVLTLFSEE